MTKQKMRIDERKIVECQKCNKVVLRKSPSQKYCEKCSIETHTEMKNRYRKDNMEVCTKRTIICQKKFAEKSKKHIQDIRKKADSENRSGIDWVVDDIKIDLLCRFSVPFDFNYSKNAIYRLGNGGHIFVRKEVNDLKQGLIDIVASFGIKWRVNKVYLDILVQKPTLRGDAINVIDTVADAIKKAINLDDNWFSIRRLDWELVQNDPHIFIGISQENEDKYPCPICGKFMTFDNFPKDRSSRFGISTPCKNCSKELRIRVKKENAPYSKKTKS